MRCATSATGSSPSGGSTSRRRTGRLRPLGLPTWSDKLVGEVVRLLLEAYYEPTFSDRSHGFRPGRGCHTALREVANTWTGTTWFIEGDIADCFGSLDHEVMLSILAEKIHDNRFLRLLRNMLQAGYLEDWVWNATLSGAPQGGVRFAGPLEYLSAPAGRLCREGSHPGIHPRADAGHATLPTSRMANALARARRAGDRAEARKLRKRMRSLPSVDPARSRFPAAAIRALLPTTTCSGSPDPRPKPRRSNSAWRRSCVTNSSWNSPQDKTLITHARTERARFLGYEITVQHDDQQGHRERSARGQRRGQPARARDR